ncbi:hypothetical protein NT01EI_3648 [Edwardsiella ictaluri 93-146]|uniref:Uncharacterized protein n=1 Tax=Edwardsiella ictaluri (strain 93-146) TaxID=634503 RepID=C5BGS9_EDWI9|nr:hypothetical protein NT01EI_3648 [Edwardsiella ictaluri 93-146]
MNTQYNETDNRFICISSRTRTAYVDDAPYAKAVIVLTMAVF